MPCLEVVGDSSKWRELHRLHGGLGRRAQLVGCAYGTSQQAVGQVVFLVSSLIVLLSAARFGYWV